MSFVIGLCLVGLVVLAIARPLLRPARAGASGPAEGAEREQALRMLAELEYDYRMEKLDEAEYRRQREALERRSGQ